MSRIRAYNSKTKGRGVEKQQEISANAHETRDSISLVLYARCHGLSPVMSLIECASQLKIAKNSQKHYFFWGGGFQGRLRSSMLVPSEKSSAVIVMTSGMSVSISATVIMLDLSMIAEIGRFDGGTQI